MNVSGSKPWSPRDFNAEDGTWVLFANWPAAARHLRDHLLTHPESIGWAILMNDSCSTVDLADADRCWEMAKGLFSSDSTAPSSSACELYDQWCSLLQDAIGPERAVADDWDQGCVVLGLNGVLLIARLEKGRKCVSTAYLPGWGSAEAVTASRSDDAPRSNTPRQREFRSATKRSNGHKRETNGDSKLPHDRFHEWDQDHKVYYLVFRRAVQFIRAADLKRPVQEGRRDNDVARLKPVLGSMKNWTIERWTSLRQKNRA